MHEQQEERTGSAGTDGQPLGSVSPTAGGRPESETNVTRRVVLGTAGHIDHGKTTLLRALTGIDCDRLPEEKQRGLTIDIGFAQLDMGGFRLDIVDVPGHERLIRNMLSGAAGIDLALLVVAADDSVMPQTREHLAILDLLGVRDGVIAITKTDRVEAEWLDLVEEEIQELVRGTFLESSPVVRTAVAGNGRAEGLDSLQDALREVCQRAPVPADTDLFRMPIDRAFSVTGRGTVVTGTIWSGQLRVHEPVECLPAGGPMTARGLQHHGLDTELVQCQQRAAVNLSGVHHSQLSRGQEIATAGYLAPSRRMTLDLRVLPDSPRGIKHRSHQRVYLGTQEIMARVELLEGATIEPGQRGLAQIHCETEAVAVCGQPLVIRQQSPLLTIGGGWVLQPCAAPVRRRQRERIARLGPLGSADGAERAEAAAYFYGTRRWNPLDLCRDAGLSLQRCQEIVAQLLASGQLVEVRSRAKEPHRVHRDVIAELQQKIVRTVERFHQQSPLAAAMPRSELAQLFQPRHELRVIDFVIQRLLDEDVLRGDSQSIARAGCGPRLSETQQRLREQLLARLLKAEFQPPDVSRLSGETGAEESEARTILRLAAAEGALVHLGDELYLHPQAFETLKQTLQQAWGDGSGFTVSQLRDRLGTSRKYALPICQYLDRTGWTRRDGDLRRLQPDVP